MPRIGLVPLSCISIAVRKWWGQITSCPIMETQYSCGDASCSFPRRDRGSFSSNSRAAFLRTPRRRRPKRAWGSRRRQRQGRGQQRRRQQLRGRHQLERRSEESPQVRVERSLEPFSRRLPSRLCATSHLGRLRPGQHAPEGDGGQPAWGESCVSAKQLLYRASSRLLMPFCQLLLQLFSPLERVGAPSGPRTRFHHSRVSVGWRLDDYTKSSCPTWEFTRAGGWRKI